MTKKKKVIIISSAIAAAVAAAALILYFTVFRQSGADKSKGTVYVESVAALTGTGNNYGVLNRFTGVVDPQETLEIQKSSDKTVKEILVKEGEEVKAGTPLFTYDTDEISLKLSQAQLDLEGLTNDINALYTQIAQTEKEKANAPQSEQLSYTTQIQSLQNDARRAEYNKKSKQAEIEQIRASLNNATVTSEIAGAVKSINPEGTDNFGNSAPFMTIIATGNYRIKGTANEQNVRSLSEGQPMIIHSRLDEAKTWTGTISKVETEPATDNNNVVYGPSGGESSSNYNFYVGLDDTSADLILGQHVYLEPNAGQSEKKEGLWLMEGYFVIDGNTAYAWVKNDKNRLEKREIVLGDYNSELAEYQIVSGLTEEDYIAWPMASFEEGLNCTTDISKADYQETTDGDINMGDGEIIDDGGGEIIDGGNDEITDGGNGEIIDGGDGEITDGGNGEIIDDGGEITDGGNSEIIDGGNGEIIDGGNGEITGGSEAVIGGADSANGISVTETAGGQ